MVQKIPTERSHRRRLFASKGGFSEAVLDQKRHAQLYLKMRGVDLADKEQVSQVQTEYFSLSLNTRVRRKTWGGLLFSVFGDTRGLYNPVDDSIQITQGKLGTQRRRERNMNRALIHETMHAADDARGELTRPVPRAMTIMSNLGGLAFKANLALAAITRDNAIEPEDGMALFVADRATIYATIVGLVAYRLNPAERRARAAERVFYDAQNPLVTIEPLNTPGTVSVGAVPPLPASPGQLSGRA
jgi:hypothetical protein